jgi:hypothetical protein
MKYRNSCAPRGSEESARPSTSRTRNDNLALERRADKYTPWEKATRGQGCLSHMANGSEPAARQGGDEPRSIHQPTTNIQPTTTNQPTTNNKPKRHPNTNDHHRFSTAPKRAQPGKRTCSEGARRSSSLCGRPVRPSQGQQRRKAPTKQPPLIKRTTPSVRTCTHTLTRTRKHSHASTHTRVSRKI